MSAHDPGGEDSHGASHCWFAIRTSDQARVFITAFRCRTGDERYGWTNTLVGVLEGVLEVVGVGGRARGRLFECRPTLA